MAGRPRKDPDGGALVALSMSVTTSARQAIRTGAETHGMSVVDYLCALVAADTGRQLPGVPALQEVLLSLIHI